jgi:predicted Zn-dependent peptidase
MNATLRASRLVAETRHFPLSCGADLLVRRSEANDIVAMECLFPMGAREESPAEAGLSMLALRMLTRGTKTKSDFELATALESIGASFSTDVQKDRASLSVQTTVEQFPRTLDLVEEILTEATFPAEDFEIEKEILVQEIREDLDSPFTATSRLFQATLFHGHPYGHPSSGTVETVSGLEHERASQWFRERFSPSGMTVAVVGKVEPESLKDRMESLFGRLPDRKEIARRAAPQSVAAPSGRVEAYENRATEAECMIHGYPGPPFGHPDQPAFKVMDSVMGGSMDSRLFSEIREKQGLVYQIGSSYAALEWQGIFAISLISTYQNHDTILKSLAGEVDRIRDEVAGGDEVSRAKTYLQGTFLMSQEKTSDQASLLARYHTLGAGIEFIDNYPLLLEEVSPEQVREAAGKYLTEATLAIVGPGEAK